MSITPEGTHVGIREVASFTLAAALFVLLLLSVQEALTPPLVFGLFVWAVWPLRVRPEVRSAILVAALLITIWFIDRYGQLLVPFLLSVGLAYIISPLVTQLTRRGAGRGLAIAGVVVPFLAVVTVILIIAIPQLMEQSQTLVTRLPGFADRAIDWLGGIGDRLARLPFLSREQKSVLRDLDAARVGAFLQQHAQGIFSRLSAFGLGIFSHLGSILGFLAYVVVTPVVAFYLLLDWKKFTRSLADLVPKGRRDQVMTFLDEYDVSLGHYIRGQLIEALIVGTLTTIGLAVLGVPSSLLLGVITGVFNLIPYVGFTISIIPALIVGLTMDSATGGLIRVIGVFAGVQFIDGNITGPRIVGNSVGLHPIWIMIALTLSGAFFGFTGLLLAVPLAVLAKMLLTRGLAKYKASEVYNS